MGSVTTTDVPPPSGAPARQLPFSVVAKPTGAACNLDCEYCFFLSKDLLYDEAGQRMSEDMLQTYVERFLASQPDGDVTMLWQGGEPTLRGLPFFERAFELAEKLRRPKQRVAHAIQTNATLLNDDWGRFLKEHDVLMGVSMDGPEDIHDSYRVNKAGRGTFAQVRKGWELLQRHGVEANILCTVHHANEHQGARVYRFFRDELGAKFMQFIPIVERVPDELRDRVEKGWGTHASAPEGDRVLYQQRGSAVTGRSVTPAGWGEFMSAVFDEWIASDVGTVYVQHFDSMLSSLFNIYPVCVHAPTCGDALAIEFNGDVYSCDHFVEPDYHLGNVTDYQFSELVTSPFQRSFGAAKASALPGQCQKCPVRRFCHGGCPKDRFTTTRDGEGGLNYLCEGYFNFFTHAKPDIVAMARLIRANRAPADIMAPDVRAAFRPSGR